MEHPLGIDYTQLPAEEALFGDTRWVLMCLAHCGNKPSTFRELQIIFDALKARNASKINTTMTHANNRARDYGKGIIHSDGHCCLTPKSHRFCTKRATDERGRTVLVYVDETLLPIFDESGNDRLHANMTPVPRRQRSKTSEIVDKSKKRKADNPLPTPPKEKKKFPLHKPDVTCFADEMMMVSSRRRDATASSRSNNLVAPCSSSSNGVKKTTSFDDAFKVGHRMDDLVLPHLQCDDFEDILGRYDDADGAVENSYCAKIDQTNGVTHASSKRDFVDSFAGASLDFIDAVDKFFADKEMDMVQQCGSRAVNALPLFPEDAVDEASSSLSSLGVLDMFDDFGMDLTTTPLGMESSMPLVLNPMMNPMNSMVNPFQLPFSYGMDMPMGSQPSRFSIGNGEVRAKSQIPRYLLEDAEMRLPSMSRHMPIHSQKLRRPDFSGRASLPGNGSRRVQFSHSDNNIDFNRSHHGATINGVNNTNPETVVDLEFGSNASANYGNSTVDELDQLCDMSFDYQF